MPIQIISATPGPTTEQTIFDLILTHPQGLTVKELSQKLNRPVSMIQICLKSLIAEQKIYVRLSHNGMQKIYYPYEFGRLGNIFLLWERETSLTNFSR